MDKKNNINIQINKSKNDAMIVFNEGTIVKLNSYGIKDLYYCGYLTFIDGSFTIDILRNSINSGLKCRKIFAIKQAVWNIDLKTIEQCDNLNRLMNKDNCSNVENIVILTKNLPVNLLDKEEEEINEVLKKNNIVLIVDFQNEMISKLLKNDNNYINYQYKECVVATFSKSTNIDLNDILLTAKQLLTNVSFFQNNFIKNLIINNPFLIKKCKIKFIVDKWKKLKIFNSKKRVAIFDFGISQILLDILSVYFELIVLPIDNSPKRTKYLHVDGIIISNSVVNYKLVDIKIKENIKNLLNWNKPVLGIAFGGSLLADITGNKIEYSSQEECLNNYTIYDNDNKNYYVSNTDGFYIKELNNNFVPIFYNREDNKIVGAKGDNKIFLTFDFLANNIYTATILNLFEEMMNG